MDLALSTVAKGFESVAPLKHVWWDFHAEVSQSVCVCLVDMWCLRRLCDMRSTTHAASCPSPGRVQCKNMRWGKLAGMLELIEDDLQAQGASGYVVIVIMVMALRVSTPPTSWECQASSMRTPRGASRRCSGA